MLRQAPAWRKLHMVEDTNRSVKDLLLTGLRHRFPQDSPVVLRRRLANLWLGPELSAAAYGPMPGLRLISGSATSTGRELRKTRLRPCAGIAWLPNRDTLRRSIFSAGGNSS